MTSVVLDMQKKILQHFMQFETLQFFFVFFVKSMLKLCYANLISLYRRKVQMD